jgi:HK97 family phage major capsid protein
MDKATVDRRAGELNEQAQVAYKSLVDGEITEAEFNTKMKAVEDESERNQVLFKSRQRANQFQVIGNEDEGAPPQSEEPVHEDILAYRRAFGEITKAARERHRGGGAFRFGYKSWLDNDYAMAGFMNQAQSKSTGMPTGPYQGVAGMSGENASGTTAGSALSNGTYFLTGTAGPAIEPEFIPGIVEMRFFPTVIESLFPALPVSSPIITYVTETGWTNAAAATGEAATKPTSTHTLQRYTEQVGKIANLERTTDEMIQDAAYVWALFQRRLVMGVQRRTEVELLAGTGYPGVNGLLGRSASFTQGATVSALSNVAIPPTIAGPFGTGMGSAETVTSVTPGRSITNALGSTAGGPAGNDIALGILQMITDLRTTVFFEPDAIVMNPQDYYTLRTAVDKNGQYFGGSFWGRDYGYPNDQGQLSAGGVDTFTLWGKKLVTTPVIPPGLILVGDFADAGAVLRLGGLRVDVTNLNGTDFEQNMWTARAEARVGLLIERPYLFELGVLETGTTWSS